MVSLVERDTELARLGRCEAQIKLRMGELFDALFELGGHHELGFSSFEAYVVERCQRSRSWARETRAIARRIRVRGLEALRGAILSGRISWSMAELLARHATREREGELIEQAAASTVRAMQEALTGKTADDSDEEPLQVPATRWVSNDDVVMLEASRVLVDYLNGARANDEELLTALLGEAETTLQSIQSARRHEASSSVHLIDAAQIEAWAIAMREERARRSADSEPRKLPPVLVAVVDFGPLPATIAELDQEIRQRASELARRNLEIGRLATPIFASRAWRGLGYASAEQYAGERVGLSLSSIRHRISLARRADRYSSFARALESGAIGYEAGLLVSQAVGRFASDTLVDAWIDRAAKRTVKHLHEEVEAVSRAIELRPDTSRLPPSDEDMEASFDFERKIQSGELLRSWLGSSGAQISVCLASARDRLLRMSVSPDLYVHWQNVEAAFRALVGPEASFISFMCTSLWSTWLPFLEAFDDKWKLVYRRDRHRCSNPVCERRDATPHHFRYALGDEPEDVGTLCSWYHLSGIHRGRIRAGGTAAKRTWMIGRDPIVVVSGREKLAG